MVVPLGNLAADIEWITLQVHTCTYVGSQNLASLMYILSSYLLQNNMSHIAFQTKP